MSQNTIPAEGVLYRTFVKTLNLLTVQGPRANTHPDKVQTAPSQLRLNAVNRWKEIVLYDITSGVWETWPIEAQKRAVKAAQVKADRFKDEKIGKLDAQQVMTWLEDPANFVAPLLQVQYHVHRDPVIYAEVQTLRKKFVSRDGSIFQDCRDPFLLWLQKWSYAQPASVRFAARNLILSNITHVRDYPPGTPQSERLALLPHDYVAFANKALTCAEILNASASANVAPPAHETFILDILKQIHPTQKIFARLTESQRHHLVEHQISLTSFVAEGWPTWDQHAREKIILAARVMVADFMRRWNSDAPRGSAIASLMSGPELGALAHSMSTQAPGAGPATMHSLASSSYARISHRTALMHGTTKARWERANQTARW